MRNIITTFATVFLQNKNQYSILIQIIKLKTTTT